MNRISYLSAIVLAAFLTLGAAQAQQTPLIGSWQTTHPAGPDGPAFVTTITYSENGSFYYEMAIAPSPGKASAIMKTQGQYRMAGPNTVQVMYGNSVLCGATTGCSPAPGSFAPNPGSSQSFNFQMQGSSQLIGEDGTHYVRVR
jgi:hypothetical protein